MILVFKFKKILGLFLTIIGSILLVFNSFNDKNIEVFNEQKITSKIIVVDAGHGEPDSGATSKNGIKESDLNLQIALKLEEKLNELGYKVIMTRNTEKNIADADKQNTIRSTKVSDINNRIKIVNESNADILVSIHMNKFNDSKYRGWQTFYKKDSIKSKELAENIQKSILESVEIENNRTPLIINNIKLIEKSKIPSIIVECGFLSNDEEVKLLLDETYQNKFVEGIVNGIEKFYKNI